MKIILLVAIMSFCKYIDIEPQTIAIEIEAMQNEIVQEPKYNLCDVPLEQDFQVWLFDYCEKKGISPYLVMAMCERESQYNSREVGDNGESFGMMQIQPKWHKQRMGMLGCYNLLDPQENIIIGIDILLYLFDKSDDVAWVLMAYNGGEDYANINYNEGNITEYATYIMARAEEMESE